MGSEAFLGVPCVDAWLFAGLACAAMLTSFIGTLTGTAGGLVLLAIMAMVFPPAVLVPVHTIVQLGAGSSRAVMMWRYILRGTVLPFLIGSGLGAAIGAQIFVTLPSGVLQGTIGLVILFLAWMPKFTRFGPERGRFAVIGFGSTFLGMFVSATGTLVAPFVAGAAPDRRNHAATLATLMAITHIMKLIAFGILGVAVAGYAPLIAVMIAAAVIGNMVGQKALNHLPERVFRIVFQVLLTGLALRLVWIGARDTGLL